MNRSSASSESDLIRRARDGDAAAITALVEAHAAELLEVVRCQLGDRLRRRLESRDVVQQVYVDALNGLKNLEARDDASFLRWLKQIAMHRICDVDRRAFRTFRRGNELRAADLSDAGTPLSRLFVKVAHDSPSGLAARDEQVLRLRRALEALGADQREAIELRYLRCLDVAETAARMGRSESAVRSLCVRALIRLREVLDDAGR